MPFTVWFFFTVLNFRQVLFLMLPLTDSLLPCYCGIWDIV